MRLLTKQAAIVLAFIFTTFVALSPAVAFAQDLTAGAIVIAEPTFVQQMLTALVPVFALVITTLVGIGLALLKQKTGIDIEAKHRDALQSALLNGLLFALQKAGWVAGQPVSSSILPDLLPAARSYVESSVPDALAKFGIDAATSAGRATLDRLLTPKLPVAIGTIMPNGDKLVGRAP